MKLFYLCNPAILLLGSSFSAILFEDQVAVRKEEQYGLLPECQAMKMKDLL